MVNQTIVPLPRITAACYEPHFLPKQLRRRGNQTRRLFPFFFSMRLFYTDEDGILKRAVALA